MSEPPTTPKDTPKGDELDKILFEHRWRAIADFHEAKDGLIPEKTKHQDEAKQAINEYVRVKESEARISEASWWTRNMANPDYAELLEKRLDNLQRKRMEL